MSQERKPQLRNQEYVRIIFDRGLQLLNSEQSWLIPSSKSHHTVEGPEELERRFAVRRITVYRDIAPFLYPRQVLDKDGRPLSKPRYLAGYVEEPHLRIYKYMVEHFLFTGATHLAYLAEAYAGLAVLKNHSEWQIGEDTVITSSRHLYSSALLHAESVFAALASALDASRFLIWRGKRNPPDSLIETLGVLLAQPLPPRLDQMLVGLEDLWHLWGDRILGYRDCGAHYHSADVLGGRSGGELLFDDIWEIFIDLPDNPEAGSADEFTFADDIDALDTCWDASIDVIRTLERCLPEVFNLAQRYASSRGWLADPLAS